ncbi:MAG: IPT/TIG domain-containing protein [Candidatus Eisenbacteria bacterium]
MIRHRAWPWPVAAAVVLLLSCSSGGNDNPGTPSGPTDDELAGVAAITASQSAYYADAVGLAAVMDTAAALDSLEAIISEDPDVEWAVNNGTGVGIQWKSGHRGFVVLRLRGGSPGSGKETPTGGTAAPSKASDSGDYTVPTGRNSVFFAPCHSEFEIFDDTYIDSADVALPRAGFVAPAVWKDEQVTLAGLASMASGNYGVIRISSHGSPWPNENDIREVYIITGEIPTEDRNRIYWQDLESGHLAIGAYAGGERYFIDSEFLASRVAFGDASPLVLNGFCFGWMGGWPEDLRTRSKAGAVLGWDWETLSSADANRAAGLLSSLCDTTAARPMTIQRWHVAEDPYYMEEERKISLHYTAADSFALQSPVKITSITPSGAIPGTSVVIEGTGFGTTPGQVHFGFTPVTQGTSWGASRIEIQVPQNAESGETTVIVTTAAGRQSNGFPFTVIGGELLESLWNQIYIEIYLHAPQSFNEIQETNIFHENLSPLVWNGTTFSYENYQNMGTESHLISFSGSVGADGRTLDLVYTRADTSQSATGRSERYEHMRITGLSYEEPLGSDERYYATGAGVQGLVSELDFTEKRWDEQFEMVLDNQYLSTDWEATYMTIWLSVVFR